MVRILINLFIVLSLFLFNCKMEARNALADSVVGSYTKTTQVTYSRYAKSIKKHDFRVRYKAEEFVTCYDRPNKLSVILPNGEKKGWSCSWKKNNKNLSVDKFEYSYKEESKVRTNDIYEVSVQFKEADSILFEETCNFYIEVWPQPTLESIPDILPGYFGEEIIPNVKYSGGYANGWKIVWLVNSKDISSPNNNNGLIVPEGTTNGEVIQGVCKISNSYGKNLWFSKNQNFTIKAWEPAKAYQVEVDSIDTKLGYPSVQNNSHIVLKSIIEGGSEDGWLFKWQKNGVDIPEADSTELEYDCQDETLTYADNEFSLHYSNIIDGRVGLSGTFIYNLRIWAEARMPEKIDGPTAVREGESYKLSIADAEGGYTLNEGNAWNYLWENYEGNRKEIECPETKFRTDMYYMEKKVEDYNLVISNNGPDGKIWSPKKYTHKVVVYKRPKTPTALHKKGNGSSRTWITSLGGFNDHDLDEFEYNFVFGYTTEEGKDIKFEGQANERYLQIPSDDFNKIDWVYAQWKYNDGNVVTSGKRYLNGKVDENFNGSSFKDSGRSPSDVTGVNTIENGAVNIVGNRFVAQLSKKEPARLSIYSTNGLLIKRNVFEARSDYNEEISTDDLVSGVYMVEVIVGQQRVVRKIYVHK